MKKIGHKIECVVFDLDGTIVDSEKVWKDTSLFLNKKYDIDIDNDFRLFCCGRSRKDIVMAMHKKFPSIDAASVRQEWVQMVKTQIEVEGVPLKAGFENLLDFLQTKDVKLGLATGSSREDISLYFKRTNFDANKIFDQIVTIKDVKYGKPKPDIYKKICENLHVNAKNCLCIEDSPNGAKAAWRAGLNVILVPDLFPPTQECQRKCCAILNDLNDVKDFLIKNLKF